MDSKRKLDADDLDDIVGNVLAGGAGDSSLEDDCAFPQPRDFCVNRLCPHMFCTPKQGQNVYICLKHTTELI